MAINAQPQLNVRSRFARDRAAAIARETGMTTTQVVEEALRAYVPPVPESPSPNLMRRGKLLVHRPTGRTITHEQLNAEIDSVREGRE
ncbi:MAG: hypothetical protein SNJ79_00480 [Sphingomonadaceae bacterium]